MRVLHLIDSGGMYGAEHMLLNLLPALRAIGVETALSCMSPVGSEGAEVGRRAQTRAIPVFHVDERRKISARGIMGIYRAIKLAQPQILHVHGYKATISTALVNLSLRHPMVVTYHGEAKHAADVSQYVRLETSFLRHASHVVAVSEPIRRELVARRVNSRKISVIPNGIADPLANAPEGSGEMSRRTRPFPHIVCVGRLAPEKRLDVAIEVTAALRRELPETNLSLAGAGPEEAALRQRVSDLGLDKAVEFLGYVADTGTVYREADFFLLSSDTEGSPISLIEAMAFGLPIVATSVGSVPEMVAKGLEGAIVPPGDVQELVQAFRALAADKDTRSRMGQHARRRFLSQHNDSAMAQSYARMYREVLGTGSRPGGAGG